MFLISQILCSQSSDLRAAGDLTAKQRTHLSGVGCRSSSYFRTSPQRSPHNDIGTGGSEVRNRTRHNASLFR